MEDLKARLNSRHDLERKLSAENRKLSTAVEKEAFEKKRLSMENEELMWKIRQSQVDLSSVSAIEGAGGGAGAPFSSSFSEHHGCPQQRRDSLSCSFTEGCPKSLPPFMSRYERNLSSLSHLKTL